MAYASWSVVFGEQPSAAKWNILGTNDASFNDGTGIGNDAITAAKMLYGVVRNRQGGNSGDATWATSGTTNVDTSAKDVFVQAGTNVSTNAGSKSVTFPTAFNYAPVVFLQNVTNSAHFCTIDSTPTTTGFAFECWNTANALVNSEVVFWVAIGQ